MATHIFSNDYKKALAEFVEFVNWLIDDVKAARKSGTPMPVEERVRRARELTNDWMEHAVSTYGPEVDNEHQRFTYMPPSYQLDRLASVMLSD